MPGGNTFVVGAGTSGAEVPPEPCTAKTSRRPPRSTTMRQPASGSTGPSIPTIGGMQYDSADGPGSLLPDGNVLFDVSPCVYNAPLAFFLYNARPNTLTPVPNIPNAANDSTYYTRMLALPNGQVLFNDGSNQMLVYTAGGTPNPAWAPSITSVSSASFTAGRRAPSRARSWLDSTRAPPTATTSRTTPTSPSCGSPNTASGVVTYARTSRWTSVSVAPGTPSSTKIAVPKGTATGPSDSSRSRFSGFLHGRLSRHCRRGVR